MSRQSRLTARMAASLSSSLTQFAIWRRPVRCGTALAEPCYREAVALYRSHERTPSLDFANAIRRLAVLKDDAGEIDEARLLWQETRDHYVAVNERMGIAESAGHLALLALRGGDILQSREWLSDASAAAGASADPDSLRYVRRVRALIEAHG